MSSLPKNRPTQLDVPLPAIPSGSLALDLRLGTHGWPRGRIVEIVGPSGSGKTTLLLSAIAQAQKAGGFGAFLDADFGTTESSAARLGIDLERMPFVRTNVLEEVFEKAEELVRGNAVDVIALDSVAALVRKGLDNCRDAPIRQDQEHQHRLEYYLRALLGPLSRSRAVLLISNQLREKVGVFFGNPETTPWVTTPLTDLAAQRVDLRRVSYVKDGDTAIGQEVKAKVVKNRQAAPMAVANFEMRFASGIRAETDLISLGLEAGLVSKRGARLYFGEQLLGAGLGAALDLLNQDAELFARLRDGIVERMKG